MTLQQKIREEMKGAMREKSQPKLDILRGLLSAFTNENVVLKRKPDGELSDEEVLKVIQREAKRRKDSIDQFKKGGREDLVKDEEGELKVLEEYLPEMMSREEIEKIATAKKAELGATDKTKIGALMGAIIKETKGRADGNVVKEIVDSLFA